MFYLKKLMIPFMLPPGVFILVLLISGMWFLWRKNRLAGRFNICLGLILWWLSLPMVSNFLLLNLEYRYPLPAVPSGDAIVVLGGGANDGAPDISGTGTPGNLDRIVTAARLQKRLKVPVIVTGGKVYAAKMAEAVLSRRFLIDLGVPAHMVLLEDRSRDTMENAEFSKAICDANRFRHPILVTSALHMRRAVFAFRQAGLDVLPFPTGYMSWKNRRYAWVDFLPGDYQELSAALHEYIGWLYYRIGYERT